MKKGFTLVELLVVIGIILILFGLVADLCKEEARKKQVNLISTNIAGQETWEVGTDRLSQFQTEKKDFRIISLSPIQAGGGEYSSVYTSYYVVIIEPLSKVPEKDDAK
jgi:prepilin-type N-terminal cleavage/methylation domain-containing protein